MSSSGHVKSCANGPSNVTRIPSDQFSVPPGGNVLASFSNVFELKLNAAAQPLEAVVCDRRLTCAFWPAACRSRNVEPVTLNVAAGPATALL